MSFLVSKNAPKKGPGLKNSLFPPSKKAIHKRRTKRKQCSLKSIRISSGRMRKIACATYKTDSELSNFYKDKPISLAFGKHFASQLISIS